VQAVPHSQCHIRGPAAAARSVGAAPGPRSLWAPQQQRRSATFYTYGSLIAPAAQQHLDGWEPRRRVRDRTSL